MPLRSFTPAEVLVSERRRLERPLVVMCWLSMVLFSLAEGSAFFLVAGTAVAAIKLLAVSRGKELYLRRLFVNAGVLMATGVTVITLLIGAADPVIALGHYLILILLCKFFERSGNRDYVQMLALGLLTVMSACVFCDRLWFAALVLAYLGVASYTAMVLTLKRGLDSAAAARLPTESGPLPPHRVAWNVRREWPARALQRLLAASLISMVLMGVVVFLVAPRTPRAAMRSRVRRERSSAVIGYSGSVALGDARSIYLSDRVAMRVRLEGNDPPSPRPEAGASAGGLYLRGHTFEGYAGSRWSPRSDAEFVPADDPPEGPWGPPPRRPVLRQQITMVRSLLPTLFAVYPAVQVRADGHTGPLLISNEGELRLLEPAGAEPWVTYTADSWTGPPDAAQLRYLAQRRVRDLEFWPLDRARATHPVRELARQWCEDLLDRRPTDPQRRDELDLAIAHRLAERLRAGYRYSLDLSACDPSRDGVEDFLFHMKQGHCEYFASTLTVMCRSLGVRARLATGFHADDSALEDGVYVVRDRHAHAWTEVFTPQTDWVVVDATPGGEPSPVPRHWYSSMEKIWQSAHQFWQDRVVNYGEAERAALTGWFRRAFRAIAGRAAAWGRAVARGLQDLLAYGTLDRAVARLALALGGLGAVLEAVLVVRLVRRRTRPRRQLRSAMGPHWRRTRFLLRLLRLLERRGIVRAPCETPLETARRAADALDLEADRLVGLVGLYYRLRWGGRDAHPQEVLAAERAVAQLGRELSRRGAPPVANRPAAG